MAVRIQVRRDTLANWNSNNPTLESGEIAFVTDQNRIKIGNGSTPFTSLDYLEADAFIDSVILGTDTTGDYVETLIAGDGISVSGEGTESASATVTNTGVLSLTGTTNEITVSGSTGDITLSLPTSITVDVVGDVTGNADTATTLATPRNISLGGDVSGSSSFDGSADIVITATVADDSHNHIISNVDGLQNELDGKASLSGDTFTGVVTLAQNPTQALEAATKQYVDSTAEGIVAKPQVEAATTTNITATYNNGTSGVGATLTIAATATLDIDGHTSWSQYDGVLIKDQTNAYENGRYVITTVGDAGTDWVLTRCGLCDEASEIPGMYIFVNDGTLNANTGWVAVVDDVETFTVGTDDIDFYQFSGAGTYTAGTGLSLTGTQFSNTGVLSLAGTTDEINVSSSTGSITLSLPATISANISGNSATSTQLETSRSIALTGDVTGSANFDGSANISITATVADDSHSHVISNVDGLQTALNDKLDSSSYTASDVLTKIKTVDGSTSGLDADLLDGQHGSYYLDWTNTTNKPDPTITLGGDASGSLTLTNLAGGTLTVTVSDDSHNHIISNVDGLQTALNDKADDNAVVHLAGAETITGEKTFSATINGVDVDLTGSLTAISKSFDIEHPTKENMRLRYGSLEGPELGVYVRGRSNSSTITLPDYWTGLVDENSITVQLTPIGKHKKLYVKDISNNTVTIGGCRGDFEFFYFIQAERKDIDKLVVEYGS